MDPNFWQKRWQNNEIAFHQPKVNEWLCRFIDRLNIQKGDTVFVPLCGKTEDMHYLAQQGYKVIGVELSPIACQDFFRERGLTAVVTEVDHFSLYEAENIQIYCGDFFQLTKNILRDVKAVYDRAALIALPADLRSQYVAHLKTILRADCRILLLSFSYDNQRDQPPFCIDDKAVQVLFADDYKIECLGSFDDSDAVKGLIERGFINPVDWVFLLSQD